MILIAPTGWAGAGYRRRSSEARFDHLLIKPASLEAPAAAIGRGTVEAR